MKTVNYTLTGEPVRASGNAGSRSRRLPKVVDLAAWRAEHLEPDEPARAPEGDRNRAPVRRRRTALDWAELAATLAVTAAFLALAARVLLF